MRIELKQRDGQRFRIRGRVEKYGTKRAYKGNPVKTILLKDLRNTATGTLIADHLWITCGKWCQGICAGEMIEFDARVGSYVKGYQGRREDMPSDVGEDYRLERPTHVVRIETQETAS